MCHIVWYIVICKDVVLYYILTAPFYLKADGDPQWWVVFRQAVSEEDTRHLLDTIRQDDEAQ